ncbi:MAG: type I-MYXAN CRISPR-associated protein Cas6/Cmx6 [Gammaproteobacteria bacterium]|nr:type I-MYXAN CRISPR-associated protein Cas6/Cmx6 [Gammaproteobacteria bacterium]MDH3448789.1 type I-MYXAN CRISPR-associated protein Cas6/Cmx6 [Gammaproteobacteria bacterium]
MFWREDKDSSDEYRVPDDVFDLVFKLRGESLDIDHAFALSEALRACLSEDVCARIGVHGIRMADSGNGWNRPEGVDAKLPLSKRARLAIRVHRDDSEAVSQITEQKLRLGDQAVEIGVCTVRKLSVMGTLYARAISCDPQQTESDFLQQVAAELNAMDIDVAKMMCGRSGCIRTDDGSVFTRALLVADLKAEESVALQQRGLGDARMLGCGLFVPHRGIAAVYEIQE